MKKLALAIGLVAALFANSTSAMTVQGFLTTAPRIPQNSTPAAQTAQAPATTKQQTPAPSTDAEKAYAWKLLQAALANSNGTATSEQQGLFAIIQERQDGQLTERANQARDYALWANSNLEEAGAAARRESQRALREANERLERQLSGARPSGISYEPENEKLISIQKIIAGL